MVTINPPHQSPLLPPSSHSHPTPLSASLSRDLALLRSRLEAILSLTSNAPEAPHPTRTSSTTTLSLVRPVVRAHLCGGVSTAGTGVLLFVERSLVAPAAKGVRLGAVDVEWRGEGREECGEGWERGR